SEARSYSAQRAGKPPAASVPRGADQPPKEDNDMSRSFALVTAAAAAFGAALPSASGALIDFSSVPVNTPADGLVVGDATFSASSLPVFLGDPAIVTDNTLYQYV